jgi:predicted lipid-binding transport protein (Tim44 family)
MPVTTTLSIVLLAMIAAFLGLRLYSVLGKRTGHEQEPALPRADDGAALVPPPSTADKGAAVDPARRDRELVYDPAAENGLRALLAADRNFDAGRFLEGAQAAYRMILEAYWSGDRTTLRDLCDDDTYEAFASAIDAREARSERLDNRLVAIETARIADVLVHRGEARVTVRFDADIAAVTRDADGNVIAGSLTDAAQTHDRWTFSRRIASADPNWKLDETETD